MHQHLLFNKENRSLKFFQSGDMQTKVRQNSSDEVRTHNLMFHAWNVNLQYKNLLPIHTSMLS